jgi:TPP-dependent pyruvate/acetoin dehydrogenase alpha subunit
MESLLVMTRTWLKGNTVRNTNSRIDPPPEEFRSDEEAADFWDRHSITDYEEFLEPAELEADIQRRHFKTEADEESFLSLRDAAKKQQKPVRQLASEILKQKLSAG